MIHYSMAVFNIRYASTLITRKAEDLAGRVRGADMSWDRGAYEFIDSLAGRIEVSRKASCVIRTLRRETTKAFVSFAVPDVNP
jgi:hypothetical protein